MNLTIDDIQYVFIDKPVALTHCPWDAQMKIKVTNYKLILVIDGWGMPCEIALRWMSRDLTIVNIGPGNGLVLSAIPRANIDPNLHRSTTSLSHIELIMICALANTYGTK